jgi:hypothetical protein
MDIYGSLAQAAAKAEVTETVVRVGLVPCTVYGTLCPYRCYSGRGRSGATSGWRTEGSRQLQLLGQLPLDLQKQEQ